MRTHDPIGRAEELSRLSGFTLLRHLGIPRDDLPALAEAAAERGGAKANPALPQPTTFSGSSRASGEGTATSLSPSTARSSG